jgi:hypothetical protein
MHFYEVHEGDEEVGAAVLLAHEEKMDPFDFFELVKRAKALVLDHYEEDSLAEAIANYLLTEEGDTRTLFMKREGNGESHNGEEEEHDH